MDPQPLPQNNQPITPQPTEVVNTVDPTTPPKQNKPNVKIIIISAISLTILVFLFIYVKSQQQPAEILKIVPTDTVTPTPIRTPASYASDSAFLTFETDISTFITSAKDIQLSDPAIAPPVITVPLGFSK